MGVRGRLDYMHARYCSPELGRFASVDPINSASPTRPQSWNRYSYAIDNPVKFRDPDGRAVETAWDVANVSLGVASLTANLAAGNVGGAVLDVAGLLVDGAATALPGVPGGAATTKRALQRALLAKNAARGRAFEKAALDALGAAKNTSKVTAPRGVKTIPDLPVSGLFGVTDIKDIKKLSFTKQLRAQAAIARKEGVPLNLIASPMTESISKPLLDRIKRLGGRIFIFDSNTGLFRNAVLKGTKIAP